VERASTFFDRDFPCSHGQLHKELKHFSKSHQVLYSSQKLATFGHAKHHKNDITTQTKHTTKEQIIDLYHLRLSSYVRSQDKTMVISPLNLRIHFEQTNHIVQRYSKKEKKN